MDVSFDYAPLHMVHTFTVGSLGPYLRAIPADRGVGGVERSRWLHTAASGPDGGKYSSSKVHPRQLCR
jgi:hypothetical protein